MKYIVIGLGNFGKTIARELTAYGNEVIAVDSNSKLADSFKDEIATTYILDVSNEEELRCLPLSEVDAVIVAIGNNFGVTIQTIAYLKKAGVKHIYARVNDHNQASILEMFNIDEIIEPEIESAEVFAIKINSQFCKNAVKLDKSNSLYTVIVNQELLNADITASILKSKFNLRLVAMLQNVKQTNILGMTIEEKVMCDIDENSTFPKDAELMIIGSNHDFNTFSKKVLKN